MKNIRLFLILTILITPSITFAQSTAYNLGKAISKGDVDEVKKHIEAGVDVNAQYNGRNALHVACEEGSFEIVKMLLEQGADVNSRMDEGKGLTALQNAISAYKYNFDIIKLLLDMGADVNTIGPYDTVAVSLAVQKTEDKSKSLKVLNLLIDKGANVNPEVKGKKAPLILAITYRRPDMLEVLLNNGADANRTGKDSKSPLHYAVEGGDIESVKLLIAHKAEVDVKDKKGKTPLDYAKTTLEKIEKSDLDPDSKKEFEDIGKEIVKLLSR